MYSGPIQQPTGMNPEPIDGPFISDSTGGAAATSNVLYGILVVFVILALLFFGVWTWICVRQNKTPLDALQVCVEFIKLHIMVPDVQCDDGDPCTIDLCQDGGCSHKYVKPPDQVPCDDFCFEPPMLTKKKDGTDIATISLRNPATNAVRNIIPNGICGSQGVCSPFTECKGQCQLPEEKKRDVPRGGLSLPARSAGNQQVQERSGFMCEVFGCPHIIFDPAILSTTSCECLTCNMCLWSIDINVHAETMDDVDTFCLATALKNKKCNAVVLDSDPLKPCLSIESGFCGLDGGKKKNNVPDADAHQVATRTNFDFKLTCHVYFVCAKNTNLQPFNP